MGVLLENGIEPTSIRARWEETATRRLCAGVHLDRKFRDLVVKDLHNDWKRRVAPSSGFDAVPVIIHAWRSLALDAVMGLLLMCALAVGARPISFLLCSS
jgi:hypothetical protein